MSRFFSRSLALSAIIGITVTASAAVASAETLPETVPCVQKLAVVNDAGFVLSFTPTTRDGKQGPPSEQYPINQHRVADLTVSGFPLNTEVRPVVSAVGGDTVAGNTFVSYCANGQTATYSVTGTTLDYSVTLIS